MGLKEEIHKVIEVFDLNLDGDLLYEHYTNNTNNFRTNLDAKKAKLLEGPMVQVMSTVASRGGQKGGNLLIIALLIVIFGMTMLIYNKQKQLYKLGARGRNVIAREVRNVHDDTRRIRGSMTSLLKSALENTGRRDDDDDDDGPRFHNITNPRVIAERERETARRKPKIKGTGSQGQKVTGSRAENQSARDARRRQRAKSAERRRRTLGGRKSRKSLFKKKRTKRKRGYRKNFTKRKN